MQTMSFETILVETANLIGTITLNRPEQYNTFSSQLAEELYEALKQLDKDDEVRVVILKGAGKAFCAGIDINELFGKTAMEYRAWIERMERPLFTISRMKKPVIAQVHGVATANGMGLVAAADLAIVAENARMGLTAINVGLNCIGPIVPVIRSVGRKRALELLLYGELISAQRALDMGLINKVVPADDLDKEAREWAAVLAQKSPIAVQISKEAFYAAADLQYEKAFNYMNEAFARLCTTEDATEGVKAFLEKRQPVWKKR
jgi:enoyl-CoA hydratase/carnithine racemase